MIISDVDDSQIIHQTESNPAARQVQYGVGVRNTVAVAVFQEPLQSRITIVRWTIGGGIDKRVTLPETLPLQVCDTVRHQSRPIL